MTKSPSRILYHPHSQKSIQKNDAKSNIFFLIFYPIKKENTQLRGGKQGRSDEKIRKKSKKILFS
jgi:hypothetical protein